jgi:hypothetical protein
VIKIDVNNFERILLALPKDIKKFHSQMKREFTPVWEITEILKQQE